MQHVSSFTASTVLNDSFVTLILHDEVAYPGGPGRHRQRSPGLGVEHHKLFDLAFRAASWIAGEPSGRQHLLRPATWATEHVPSGISLAVKHSIFEPAI